MTISERENNEVKSIKEAEFALYCQIYEHIDATYYEVFSGVID